MANATLEVETKLAELMQGLADIQKTAGAVGKAFEQAAKKSSEAIRDQSKQTESFLDKLGGLSKRVATNITEDFTSFAGPVALALAATGTLYEGFKKGVVESANLTQALALLRTRTGGTVENFDKMKSSLITMATEGRLGIDSMANAIEGLTSSSIKDLNILQQIASASALIAAARGEPGNEKSVATNAAEFFKLKGVQPTAQDVQNYFDNLYRGANVSGLTASAFSAKQNQTFSSLDIDQQRNVTPRGLAQQVAIENQISNFTKLIGDIKGLPKEYTGVLRNFEGVFKKNGELDVDKFNKAIEAFQKSGLSSAITGGTFSLSKEAIQAIVLAQRQIQSIPGQIQQFNGPQSDQRQQAFELRSVFGQMGTTIGTFVGAISVWTDETLGVADKTRVFGEVLGAINTVIPIVTKELLNLAFNKRALLKDAALGIWSLIQPDADSGGTPTTNANGTARGSGVLAPPVKPSGAAKKQIFDFNFYHIDQRPPLIIPRGSSQ